MHERMLRLLPAPLGETAVHTVLPALRAALDGSGPPVVPMEPDADAGHVATAVRPDLPVESPSGADGDQVAVVVPTSGSTGEPKGVVLTASALTTSARASVDRIGGPGRWLLTLPPSRIAGLQVLVRSLLAGTVPVALSAGWRPDDFVAGTSRLGSAQLGPGQSGSGQSGSGQLRSGRRYTSLVPTQLIRLLDAGPAAVSALASYDAILVGGAAARPALLDRATALGVPVVPTYGMTETCGGCVYAGTPLDGVTAAVDETGRIRLRGPVLFAGYRLRPDLTARALVDGWHRTADLGRFDAAGRLEVIGRADDVVVSGGVNVPLPAVERAVAALPGVADVAAAGVPDPTWGSRVVAYVVPTAGMAPPSLAEVREHVRTAHPAAYAPRELVVVARLPTLPSGKVDRLALRRGVGEDGDAGRGATAS